MTEPRHGPGPEDHPAIPAVPAADPGPSAGIGEIAAASAPNGRRAPGSEVATTGVQAVASADAALGTAFDPDHDAGPDAGPDAGLDADLDGGGDPEPAPEGPRRSTRRTVIEWMVLIVGALAIALVIKTFLFQAFFIPSESMVPTLKVGDRVLVNKLSYKLHDVNRGDIVVFRAPPGTETAEIKDLVKRVVGLPGETVEGRGGNVYIDGRLLREPYLPAGVRSKDFGPEKVPPGRYFMLGDNRQFSKDSTYFHSIKRSEIIGRAFVRIWPVSRIGFL